MGKLRIRLEKGHGHGTSKESQDLNAGLLPPPPNLGWEENRALPRGLAGLRGYSAGVRQEKPRAGAAAQRRGCESLSL